MKDSQFPDNEFGNALKEMVHRNEAIYKEYICEDYDYHMVCEIPEDVACFWLRQSAAFKLGLLNHYMIGPAADDPE